jgi:hypothetical protein
MIPKTTRCPSSDAASSELLVLSTETSEKRRTGIMANEVSQQSIAGTLQAENAVTLEAGTEVRSLTVGIIVLVAVSIGLLLAIFWIPAIADDTVGETIANTILGSTASSVPISNAIFSIAFAIAAGIGTTFTACNCVVFSCIAPLSKEKGQMRLGVGRLLLWMCLGVMSITAVYGITGAVLGSQVPSLSRAVIHLPGGESYPVRLLQSTTVFVILGIILWFWGLTALQIVANPFKGVVRQRPWIVPLFLGIIVGCFSVGRPYPLFHKLFQYSAGTGNPLLSAILIALQGLGNIALMSLLFVLLTRGTGGRFERWLQGNPFRAKAITAISMIGGGTFLIAYWGLRVPAAFGIGWFPHF